MDFRHRSGPCCQQVGGSGSWYSLGLNYSPPRSRHSDMTGERFFHIVIPLFIGIIGFVIAISTTRLTARYVSLYVPCFSLLFDTHVTVVSFLMVQSYSGCICFWTWAANIFARTPSKLAVALAFINSFAQLGNIVGSWVPRAVSVRRCRWH